MTEAEPYPCSHAYEHYDDEEGNMRCDECDRIVRPAKIPPMPDCTCRNRTGWEPLGHSHGCPMREHLEKYGPPRRDLIGENEHMTDDGWEARMAARARERRTRQAEAEVAEAVVLNKPRPWLNGWPRMSDGRTVLIGTGVHCVCCGRCEGITCVAFTEDWEPPGPDPQWPFDEDDCPLCVGLEAAIRRMSS